jgi:hypothetical protein
MIIQKLTVWEKEKYDYAQQHREDSFGQDEPWIKLAIH